MKRTLLVFAGFVAALSVLWVGVLHAANVRGGDSPVIMSDEVIDGTLYTAGQTITVDGTVKGDLICAGQRVNVTGTIEGDILCAAQAISISGHVEGSVRAAAQTVDVTGKIDGSATIAGQTVTFSNTAVVTRDLTALGQNTQLAGHIGRDVEALSDTFGTTASIGRDLDVTGTKVSLGKAEISGNFVYVSADEAHVDKSARIGGQTDHKFPPKKQDRTQANAAMFAASAAFGFVSFLIVGFALLLATPRLLAETAGLIQKSPLGTLGIGLMALIVPPLVAILLFISLFGLPLGIIILLGWLTAMIAGMVFTAQALGNIIVAKMQWQMAWQKALALVLGLLALFLLSLLPYIGGFIGFAAVIWGAGALWWVIFRQFRGASPAPVKEEVKK